MRNIEIPANAPGQLAEVAHAYSPDLAGTDLPERLLERVRSWLRDEPPICGVESPKGTGTHCRLPYKHDSAHSGPYGGSLANEMWSQRDNPTATSAPSEDTTGGQQ